MGQTDTPEDRSYVPRGVAQVSPPENVKTQHFVFILLPKLSMLAFSSAIEPLRIANQLTGQALYTWETRSEEGKPVDCSNGVPIQVDAPLGTVPKGATILVCSGVEPERSCSDRVAAWVREGWRHGGVVGGLCTGAYTLAKAGILQGHQFTLHWENEPAFSANFPTLKPLEKLYTIDKRIMTSSGGASATDLMLKLILDEYGFDLFHAVMDMCIHPYHRSGDQLQKLRSSYVLGTRHPKLLAIVESIENSLEDDIDLGILAQDHGISRRQMERLFKKYTGASPAQFLSGLRLARARALLLETDMTVAQVCMAAGFGNAVHFARLFRAKYGISPARFSAQHY
ncbi:GlxA family transcriptional regulator [Cochlodiniinecator piscidefendens]|uniref:GlxA family transcriptional regulator n=1 Tax=Cochlodiniinecator piscidefendens TaxID=2715756 RepID=UPI0014072310|nr:GlxA family transcriptional regulator [Cochlodiniinecator piscidefendens]